MQSNKASSIIQCIIFIAFFQVCISEITIQFFMDPLDNPGALPSNETYQIDIQPIYNILPWKNMQPIDEDRVTYHIVAIDTVFKSFNPCDETTYAPEFIAPLLERYLEDGNKTDFHLETNQKWIALINWTVLKANCENEVPLHMYYPSYAVYHAQKLGAHGYIEISSNQPVLEEFFAPPYVDITNMEVNDVKVNIPGLGFSENDFFNAISDDDFKYYNKDSRFSTLLNPQNNESFTNTDTTKALRWSSIFVTHFQFDPNPFSEIFSQFGAYRIFCGLLGMICLLLTVFTCRECRNVIKYFSNQDDKVYKTALYSRLLILIPLIISGVTRVLVLIDPMAAFHLFDSFAGRMFMTSSQAISVFTDIVTIMYCFDVYKIFKASGELKSAGLILDKHKYAGVFIIIFAFTMIIVDTTVVYLGLLGELGSYAILIPLSYNMIVSMIVILSLFRMSNKMKTEVSAALDHLEGTAATSSTRTRTAHHAGTNQQLNSRIQRTKSLLIMRRFILIAAYSRCFTIISQFLAVAGVYQTPVTFLITFLMMFTSNVTAAFAQIMAAAQLPSGDRNTKQRAGKQLLSVKRTKVASSIVVASGHSKHKE